MGLNKVIVFIGIVSLAMQPTYSASIGIGAETVANETCSCSREYSPICASDNLTYDNKCLFDCARKQNEELEIQYRGECSIENEIECICTEVYTPVCASDNRTFSNECMLECEQRFEKGLKLKYHGECEEELHISDKEATLEKCGCSKEFVPLCASDDQTYPNECTFNCARKVSKQLEIKHFGECQEEVHEECACFRIYDPICATDGQTHTTFDNECVFYCAQENNGKLAIEFRGECQKNH